MINVKERSGFLEKKHFLPTRELISYGFFGILTTLVNLAAFQLFYLLFQKQHLQLSIWIAWVISVIFAYFTNRRWVFSSTTKGSHQRQEVGKFFLSRLFSGVVDAVLVQIGVSVLGGIPWVVKLISNLLVILLNYLLSKFLVFQKK